ncbi:MAG: type II-A CRISPR-associated protein Csn2 [Proteocatella sp.]
MKIVHPSIERQIVFEENRVNVLIIENQKMLSDMIEELIRQINGESGNFVISENMEFVNISKSAEICIDMFSLEINSKKLITKLYEKLREKAMDENIYLDTKMILGEVLTYIENLMSASDEYPLVCNYNMDINSILKVADIKFDISSSGYLERIIDYISITHEFCNVKLFIFVNLKNFLLPEELEEFYKTIFYKKIDVLLFENTEREIASKAEYIYIIDKDYCQIK